MQTQPMLTLGGQRRGHQLRGFGVDDHVRQRVFQPDLRGQTFEQAAVLDIDLVGELEIRLLRAPLHETAKIAAHVVRRTFDDQLDERSAQMLLLVADTVSGARRRHESRSQLTKNNQVTAKKVVTRIGNEYLKM